MVDEVAKHASTVVKTGCVRFSPFQLAEFTSPCSLHMDCLIYLRNIDHLVVVAERVTLGHGLAPPFARPKGQARSHQGLGGEFLPNISLGEHSPLVQMLQIIEKKAPEVAKYYKRRYIPPAAQQATTNVNFDLEDILFFEELDKLLSDGDEICHGNSDEKKERRMRLIGRHVRNISPVMAELVQCLKPAHGVWADKKAESSIEKKCRIVAHIYVHLTRCLSSMLSNWFLKLHTMSTVYNCLVTYLFFLSTSSDCIKHMGNFCLHR